MTPFIEQLPRHYQISPQDAELQRALQTIAQQAQVDLNFTLAQLIPSTASGWGLALWETAYGIPVDTSLPENTRRARILAKIQGLGMTTVQKIQSVAEAFSDSPVTVVEEYGEYTFVIWYTDTVGPLEDLAGLAAIINELKPAHLAWRVAYRKTQDSMIYLGALPRQGDNMILWRVDCT